MKMIFFSFERAEVELLRNELTEAAIPCEVRENSEPEGHESIRSETELWLQQDADVHRAIMLCVQLGIGFAKRAQQDKGEEEKGLAA